MKGIKRILPIVLVILLLVGTNASAFAAQTEQTPSEKEEVVYINLNGGGAVNDIYVVNSFSGGEILDYGNYSSVKMLNTDDVIEQRGDKITFTSNAPKAYYQGKLQDTQIPWDISLHYFMDGKEYSADEIAGKSGKLEIHFQVSKNASCPGAFYEDYALQASFTLDTEQCSNISAPDATIANVGSSKQLTYTILPGEGLETSIWADVEEFEMGAVSINGIRLNLNVDVEEEGLRDKVGQLIDATTQLDDGAEALDSGAEQLKGGSGEVKDGSYALHSGISSLDQGVELLQTGLDTVQKGLDSLNGKSGQLKEGSSQVKEALSTIQGAVDSISVTSDDLSQLIQASGQIKQAIGDLYDGAVELQDHLSYDAFQRLMAANGLSLEDLRSGNSQAASSIDELIPSLEEMLNELQAVPGTESQVEELRGLVDELKGIASLLKGDNHAIEGMESYLDGLEKEMPQLTQGLSELRENYNQLDTALGSLVNTLRGMVGNLATLSGGIDRLVEQYETLDSGLWDYTDGVAQVVAGYTQVMGGVSSLAQGSKELVDGSDELYQGTAQLYDGVTSLCDGAQEMAEGAGELHQETGGMEGVIEEEIDGLLNSIGGDMGAPVSFVSPKNTQVDLVQFVIQTAPIEREEQPAPSDQPEEQTSFWQKLLGLFGIEA